MKRRYSYNGRVTFFGKVIAEKWSGETEAESRAKAESNLKYQYKKEHKMLPGAKVDFEGEVVEI